jgi:hypothetical protein
MSLLWIWKLVWWITLSISTRLFRVLLRVCLWHEPCLFATLTLEVNRVEKLEDCDQWVLVVVDSDVLPVGSLVLMVWDAMTKVPPERW